MRILTTHVIHVHVDDKLNFNDHISTMCKKINNQFNVLIRFHKLISKDALLTVNCIGLLFYHTFVIVLPSGIFCGSRNSDKLGALNKRILRFILNDFDSPYNHLLNAVNLSSLYHRRLQHILIVLYKSLLFQQLSDVHERPVYFSFR